MALGTWHNQDKNTYLIRDSSDRNKTMTAHACRHDTWYLCLWGYFLQIRSAQKISQIVCYLFFSDVLLLEACLHSLPDSVQTYSTYVICILLCNQIFVSLKDNRIILTYRRTVIIPYNDALCNYGRVSFLQLKKDLERKKSMSVYGYTFYNQGFSIKI